MNVPCWCDKVYGVRYNVWCEKNVYGVIRILMV